jgi:hypothetical protein
MQILVPCCAGLIGNTVSVLIPDTSPKNKR